MDTFRIAAAALFDDRSHGIIVAGQVLGGTHGIVGVDVRISTATTTVCVTTGPMGSFGARIESGADAIGEIVRVSSGNSNASFLATCRVQ